MRSAASKSPPQWGARTQELERHMSLWEDFLTNDGKIATKWVHYFPIYQRHCGWYRNKSLAFPEIGVSKGRSLGMWQRYFGPLARIVGTEINPACKAHEAPGIFVRSNSWAK
jgi:hypothetical protein